MSRDELNNLPEEEKVTPDTAEAVNNEDPFAAFAEPQARSREDITLSPKKKKKILLFSLIGAFVLLATLIVLLVFVFPADDQPQTPLTDPTTPTITVLDKTSETEEVVISSAKLTHSDNITVEFVKVDGELFVKGYEDLPAHETNTTDLVAVLSAFTATRELGELENDAEYGFDKPTVTGTVSYLDNSTFSFEIGAKVPDGTGYYFREKGTKKTYIFPLANAETMLLKPLEYISTTVFTGPTADNSSTSEVVLRDMALSGQVRAGNEFSFRLVTSKDNEKYLYYTYIMTKPYTKGVDSGYTSDLAAFTSLEALSVAAVRPTAAQLSEFGLKNPYSVADFTLAVRSNTTVEGGSGETDTVTTYSKLTTHQVRLGNKVGSSYYVMIDHQPIVYLVAEDALPFATLKFNDLAASTLFLENITELQKVEVGVSGKITTFTLTHNPEDTSTKTNMTVTANGKTYDTMDFRYLMNVFMDIDWHSSLSKDVGNAPERFSLSLTKTGETKPVFSAKFYQLSGSLYAAVINNGEKYQVRASDVENAITQFNNYMNGKTVLY